MFYDLTTSSSIEILFTILEKCKGVEQNNKYHPEGDVFTHSVQVLNHALKETDDIDLIFAAMLHDVGKQIQNFNHDKIAVQMLEGKISSKTSCLIENHMSFWYFIMGDMRKLSKIKELNNHKWFPELTLLCRWDKMGRNTIQKVIYDRDSLWYKIIHKYANKETP